ncbi:MAG: patatin-like phospholipase family protein, partial [Muribaculaceae bacterium]|nr:patatin-like phospholipase family protein [Muribaculaceae bacterium]
MKKVIKILTAAAVLLWSTVAVAAEKRQTVGLVLSGGGAKGIAHVGVIRALEENDIPVNYVTGTSMGAIVGSLYSCGWSPARMMELFTSNDFKYWSTGVINPDNITRISRLEPTPQWVGVNVSLKDSTGVMSMLPTSLISPIPMNIE